MKNSKAFIKIAGTQATKQAVQAYQGSDLLMDRLGIFMRAPAIQAALCVAPEVNKMTHNMLITIRKAKGEKGMDMFKGSSLPLPHLEPWSSTLKKLQEARAAQGSPNIPSIIRNKLTKARDSITMKGQMGDDRDLKTVEMQLACPRCKAVKDASKCTLYRTGALILACAACKTSSSSSQWHCNHNIRWLQCPFHREAGFRCGGSSKPTHSRTSTSFKDSRLKASLQRLKRLGHLGATLESHNSISSAKMPKKNETIYEHLEEGGPATGLDFLKL